MSTTTSNLDYAATEVDEDALDSQDALAWAGQYLNIRYTRRVTRTPWGETYRLKHEAGVAYLKIVPRVLNRAVGITRAVAQRFPAMVPSIIATDTQSRYILSAEHGGKEFGRQIDDTARMSILDSYAVIQASCREESSVLDTAPKIDITALVDDLLLFFRPGGMPTTFDGVISESSSFFSRSRCQYYSVMLSCRAPLLRRYLNNALNLPATINHCDLRPSNAAQSRGGPAVIYDWDEAVVGPAGMSLHGMFSGSAQLIQILDEKYMFVDAEKARQSRRELTSYINTLVNNQYADRASLCTGLGAAAVAGQILYILGFSRFEANSRSYRKTVRRNLQKRLSDLLDVCDILSIVDDADVSAIASEYVTHNRNSRAERLLHHWLRVHGTKQPKVQHKYGKLLLEGGKYRPAIEALSVCTDLEPRNWRAFASIGKAHALSGDLPQAAHYLRCATSIRESKSVNAYLERVVDLQSTILAADEPGSVPTISFTSKERHTLRTDQETLNTAELLFRRHGTLLLRQVFNTELLESCRVEFLERYRAYLSDQKHKDALRIGDKRFQITIDVTAPYNHPDLMGNGLLIPLMQRLLGKEAVLGCYTSAMSLPGSEDQRLHKDHKALFIDESGVDGTPSFAVTLMVPLVQLDEQVGTTRVKKGTHRLTTEQSLNMPYQTPLPTLGDCYLMDYRLSHHGQANRSSKPRPILSLVYHRPWFRDYINFHNQPSLRVSAQEYQQLPERIQQLIAWTKQPTPWIADEQDI